MKIVIVAFLICTVGVVLSNDFLQHDPADEPLEIFKERMLRKHLIQAEKQNVTLSSDPSGNLNNFASTECGAKALSSNPEAKHASAVLSEDRDRYLLTPCSAPRKWVVIELCEEALVDRVVLANFEYYSSTFKGIQILGSQQYPVDKWISLGDFHAEPHRQEQTFQLTRPAWVKFIKIRFVTHHGSEFFCPVSLVRVHGFTYLQEFKEEMKRASAVTKSFEASLHADALAVETAIMPAVAPPSPSPEEDTIVLVSSPVTAPSVVVSTPTEPVLTQQEPSIPIISTPSQSTDNPTAQPDGKPTTTGEGEVASTQVPSENPSFSAPAASSAETAPLEAHSVGDVISGATVKTEASMTSGRKGANAMQVDMGVDENTAVIHIAPGKLELNTSMGTAEQQGIATGGMGHLEAGAVGVTTKGNDQNTGVVDAPVVANSSNVVNATVSTAPQITIDVTDESYSHASIYKLLTHKIRLLEINMTLSNSFMERMHKRFLGELTDLRYSHENLSASITDREHAMANNMTQLSTAVHIMMARSDQLLVEMVETQRQVTQAWRALIILFFLQGIFLVVYIMGKCSLVTTSETVTSLPTKRLSPAAVPREPVLLREPIFSSAASPLDLDLLEMPGLPPRAESKRTSPKSMRRNSVGAKSLHLQDDRASVSSETSSTSLNSAQRRYRRARSFSTAPES